MEVYDSSDLGVNLVAYIRAEMGLGTAARGLAMAMEAAEVPFNVINFEHSNPGDHRDDSWRHKETDRSSYDFTVFALNPDNLSNATTRVQKKLMGDRYRIGYWFWELPEIPDPWLESFSLVDEVWAASRFVQDSISLKSPVPVFRVPVPVRLGRTDKFSRQHFGLPQRQFLFLSLSDTHSELERKNPLGAIRAFKKAFPDDNRGAGLVVKISNVDSVHADHETMDRIREEAVGHRNIYLLDRNMARPQVDALLALCNCFVSVHRSEGFGLGPAEAMSLGKPAILTHWSGNMDYMTPQNSIAIDYELVRLGRQYGPYPADQIWAEPDLEQAAAWMKRLVNDRDLARRIGKLGQQTIRKEFSPEVIGALIHERLRSLKEAELSGRRTKFTRHDPAEAAAPVLPPSDPPATDASLRVYFADPCGYSEDLALEVSYRTHCWTRVHVSIAHGLGTGPLRLDPMTAPGLIDIAGLTVRSARDGKVLWRASTRGGLEALETAGSAIRVPHPRLARVFSYGDDPQIFLPLLAGPDFDGPLRLEIWLKLETEAEPICAAMAELTRVSVAARAQLSSASLLSERESAAREKEIDGLLETLKGREGELEEARARIKALEIEVNRVGQGLLLLTQSLGERESELKTNRDELNLKKRELGATNADFERAQKELFLVQKQSADQKSALDESAREMASLREETALQRKQLDGGAKEIAATTFELAKVSGELAVLKRQMLSQQSLLDTLRKRRFWEVLNPLPALQRFLDPKRDQASPESDMNISLPRKLEETFWLEHPTGPSLAKEAIMVSGWVVTVSGEKIEGVQAAVNGDHAPGAYGLQRGDVGAAHPGRDDYFHSGFIINLTLPVGVHHVSLQFLTRSRGWDTFCSFEHEVREVQPQQ